MTMAQDTPDWTFPVTNVQIIGQLTDLFAVIDVSASGASELVAATASKRVVVRALQLVVAGDVGVTFQSDGGPTDISGPQAFLANGGIVLPYTPNGWFQTELGEALDIDLDAAVAVGGSLVYGVV